MKQILRFCLVVFLVLIARMSYSDIIYLKNGDEIVGQIKDDGENGVWIDGVLFGADEIDKIMRTSVEMSEGANLEVSGIMQDEESVAIINDELVKVGEKVGEATVSEIGDNFVRFNIAGVTVVKEVVSSATNKDRTSAMREYYQRQSKNREAIDEMKIERLREIGKNRLKQEETMIRARKTTINRLIQEEFKRKKSQEESDRFFGQTKGYRPCEVDKNGKLTGTCYPSQGQVGHYGLTVDDYIEVSE